VRAGVWQPVSSYFWRLFRRVITRVSVDFGKNAFEACKPFRCDQRPCNNKWLPSAIFVVFGHTYNNNNILFVSTDGRKIYIITHAPPPPRARVVEAGGADFGRGEERRKDAKRIRSRPYFRLSTSRKVRWFNSCIVAYDESASLFFMFCIVMQLPRLFRGRALSPSYTLVTWRIHVGRFSFKASLV